jgi:hypothetical protein
MAVVYAVVPHITDTIQEWVKRVSRIPVARGDDRTPEICVIEVLYTHPTSPDVCRRARAVLHFWGGGGGGVYLS